MHWLLFLLSASLCLRWYGFQLLGTFVRLVCRVYFRDIQMNGINHIPRSGPVLVCANHPNMLVDAMLLISTIIYLGRDTYCWVKASAFANPIVGKILKQMGAVPVFRPVRSDTNQDQDMDSSQTRETLAKATEQMFQHTWQVLKAGHVMVLFPEGTSYTQSSMMTLRTGMMRATIGFVQLTGQSVTVVPCGLVYGQKDTFRSNVLIDFGPGWVITPVDCMRPKFQSNPRQAIKDMTIELTLKMHDVTLNAPDMVCLQTAQMIRRIFMTSRPKSKLKTPSPAFMEKVYLTRRLIQILTCPSVDTKELETKVMEYCQALNHLNWSDRHVRANRSEYRLKHVLKWLLLGIPGCFLNVLPFYFLGKKLDQMAGFVESQSMFKIIVAVICIPIQWIGLIMITKVLYGSMWAQIVTLILPCMLYAHLGLVDEVRASLPSIQSTVHFYCHRKTVLKTRALRNQLILPIQTFITTYVALSPELETKKSN